MNIRLSLSLLISSGSAITLLKGSTVHLKCAEAYGVASCDWRCVESCTIPYGTDLNVSSLTACVNRIGAECRIPAEAHVTIKPQWFCSTSAAMDNDESDAQGYAFGLQSTEGDEFTGLDVTSRHLESLSVDVQGEFDRTACRTLIEYSVAIATDTIKDVGTSGTNPHQCSRNVERSNDDGSSTVATFGFEILNLNLTAWASDREGNALNEIGRKAQVFELATLGGCWAEAANLTVYHTSNITINAHPNGAAGHYLVSAAAVLALIALTL